MIGTFCKQVGKFDRGQMFRRYCVRCGHNTAHLGDKELRCQYLEYRKNGEVIPNKQPTIRIPPDMRR
ncbi:hypothetical protein ES703_23120 [subsurface metagenome]|nr:hypothetical protein [Dehalococcoidia bacterium]